MFAELSPAMRLLVALVRDDEKLVSRRKAFAAAGLTVRSGNAALKLLRQAGHVDGSTGWIGLTEKGIEAARQVRRPGT